MRKIVGFLMCVALGLFAPVHLAIAVQSNLALDQAARDGDASKVARLLKQDADPNEINKWGGSALVGACTLGASSPSHTRIVRLLIEGGADVNRKVVYGTTALNEASFWGNTATVRVLLDSNADVNAAKDNGWTPLHSAANNGHQEIVRMLLAAGAKVDAKNEQGSTPYDLASALGNKEVAALLKQFSEYSRTHGRKQ